MATEDAREGVIITRPNRDPATNKTTRVIVAILLLISAALMLIVMIGGWDSLVGMQAVTFGFIIIYVGAAFLVMRWNRGVLPVMAALAIILAIFAGVAAPEWFARDKTGFIEPALSNTTLGLLTAIIIPVQILLVAFALVGFRQAWNVEVEKYVDPDEVEPLPTPPPGRPLPA
jgi:hypothetical protein